MMYAYIDGDDIGLKIENSFMNNDEFNLKFINNRVKKIVEDITVYLINNNYEMIFSGADGIICKKDKVEIKKIQEFIRSTDNYLTFSIGIGSSLRDSYIALRYAKSNGKNIAANFTENKFDLSK